MPKTNIEYLRELHTTEEQEEFLDGIENDISHMKSTINDLREDLKEAKDQRDKAREDAEYWERQYDEKDEFDGEEINTGIGTIRYECEGSLDQQLLMEAIAELIKEQGVKGLLDQVRGTWGV